MVEFTLNIPAAWQHIREVRARIASAMAGYPADLREAVVMTAAELTENAIKYGEDVQELPHAWVRLTILPKEIVVIVANGVSDDESVDALRRNIETIQAAQDKQALYLKRLQELTDAPTAHGRLGLIRIAFEGQFELAYTYTKPIIVVTARRAIP
jgi:hypothetical protein